MCHGNITMTYLKQNADFEMDIYVDMTRDSNHIGIYYSVQALCIYDGFISSLWHFT